MTDVPTGLLFTDPTVVETTYRFCLWAAPGEGKTLAAATAPDPILVVNGDRPSAWAVARRRHSAKDIREARYVDHSTLDEVCRYLATDEGAQVATVVIDPWSNVYDELCAAAPKKKDNRDQQMKPDYELVNAKLMQFIGRMRRFDVHLVLICHEKSNEGSKGDGKLYPRLGGMGLIQKAMAELDVLAHVERTRPTAEEGQPTPDPVWFAQIQPTDSLAGKDGTDSLGDRRVADLTRWVELARAANAPAKQPDLPWDSDAEPVTPEASSSLTPADGSPAYGGDAPTEADTTLVSASPQRESGLAKVAAPAAENELPPVALTEADRQLLEAVRKGRGLVQQTADALGTTPDLARAGVAELKERLRIRTNAGLVEYAERRLAA